MRTANKEQMMKLAQAEAGPFSKIIKVCKENATKAAEMLKEQGYEVECEGGNHTVQARVLTKKVIPVEDRGPYGNPPDWDGVITELKAYGLSVSFEDALLHAFLGAVREEYARVTVAAELDKRGFKVDDNLRKALESRFIQGGCNNATLQADLDKFPKKD